MTDTNFSGEATSAGRNDVASDAPKDMAKAAVQKVRDEAASFADGAMEKAMGQVEQGKQTASDTMGDFANAIRKAGDDLAQHDQSMAGQMVRKAADGLESLSRSVSDKQPEEMIDAVRDFARANPAAFIAGSVLIGLAIGRFAKSSERGGAQMRSGEPAPFAEDRSSESSFSAYPMTAQDEVDRPEPSLPGRADSLTQPRPNAEI